LANRYAYFIENSGHFSKDFIEFGKLVCQIYV